MADTTTRRVIGDFLRMEEGKTSDIFTTAQSHFLLDIILENNKYKVFVVTSKSNGVPARIYNRPKGVKKSSWPTTICYADNQLFVYKISIPESKLANDARFFIERDGHWVRTLTPYRSDINLPPGWGFSNFHLYANFRSTAIEKERTQRAFVRKISSSNHKVIIEGVLISNYPPKDAYITIRKFRDSSFCWDFPLQLVPASQVRSLATEMRTLINSDAK